MAPHLVKRRKLSHEFEEESSSNGDATAERLGQGSKTFSETAVPVHSPRSSKKDGPSSPNVNRRASVSDRIGLSAGTGSPNLFKLQVHELLSEVQTDHERLTARVSKTLHDLKAKIESLPRIPPKSISEAEKALRKGSGVSIPFPNPRPTKDTKYKFEFLRPSHINVVGGFSLSTTVKTKHLQTIDLAITLPKDLFQEKDYLNHRYFHKRAYYVACIAAGLKDFDDGKVTLKYDYLSGNDLQPIIILEASGHSDSEFARSKSRIRILPSIAEGVFPVQRTLPSKNCIRHGEEAAEQPARATPFYNATLRSEACVDAYLRLLHGTSKRCDSFREACVLGRIWLRQRGMGTRLAEGGFGAFEWAITCALLLEGGGANGRALLSPGYSSYQMFRALLQFFAGRDLSTPLRIGASDAELVASDMPVIFDARRGLNALFKMTPWSYHLLIEEARATLRALNDHVQDAFEAVFIVRVDEPLQRFDRIFQISFSKPLTPYSTIFQVSRDLYTTATRALGDRVKFLHLLVPEIKSWPCSAPHRSSDASHVQICLDVVPNNANRLVDHGPSAEEKEAAADFRHFWGDKAELRRFKDGSILESLVWSGKPTEPPVIAQIMAYVLQRHHQIPWETVTSFGYDFDRLLFKAPFTADLVSPFRPLMDSFESFTSQLRELEGLPLSFRQISASDAQLRYASSQPRSGKPADVVIQFEGSARWPDDLRAIQRTKIAFLLKLGELLESSNSEISARVGLENEKSPVRNNAFLDVENSAAAIFRLRIHHDREQTLLERTLRDKTTPIRTREEYAQTLAAYKRDFVQKPRHTQAIRTLSTRFPALSLTIRLLKKWINSHLLGDHLSEELIELFAVRVFVHPQPWDAPSSTMTGFVRCLHMLSRWDWHDEPFIVDLGGELTAQDVSAMRTRFEAWRKIDPALNNLVLFVASNIDPEGTAWTQFSKPPKVVAARLSALATAAMDLVRQKRLDLNPADLFTSSLSDYDFLIHLNAEFVEGARGPKDETTFKNLQVQRLSASSGDMADYSPIRLFLDDLNAAFGHSMALFCDVEEGTVIGGLWNPQVAGKRSFGLKLKHSTVPEKAGEEVSLNRDGILNEIGTLGGDMVAKIEVNR